MPTAIKLQPNIVIEQFIDVPVVEVSEKVDEVSKALNPTSVQQRTIDQVVKETLATKSDVKVPTTTEMEQSIVAEQPFDVSVVQGIEEVASLPKTFISTGEQQRALGQVGKAPEVTLAKKISEEPKNQTRRRSSGPQLPKLPRCSRTLLHSMSRWQRQCRVC